MVYLRELAPWVPNVAGYDHCMLTMNIMPYCILKTVASLDTIQF